jgi:hypothetical protein
MATRGGVAVAALFFLHGRCLVPRAATIAEARRSERLCFITNTMIFQGYKEGGFDAVLDRILSTVMESFKVPRYR